MGLATMLCPRLGFVAARETEQKLTISDGATRDYFGSAVSVSGDTVLVGANQDDDCGTDSGSAYVFIRTDGVWTQQAKLTAADAAPYDYFGYSVSVSGDTAVIGAKSDNDSGYAVGAAYVFTRAGGVWTQQAKLSASEPPVQAHFGIAVSVSGDTALIGAFGDDQGGTQSGSAYVFIRTDGVWTQQAKLTPPELEPWDFFGVSVSVSGDLALVGAFYDDDGGAESGSAYAFARTEGLWTEEAKLTAPDPTASDFLGNSVSVSGDTAVISAGGDDDSGYNAGAAYVFIRTDGVWTQQAKLTASDAMAQDHFGSAVSLSGDTAVIGAYFVDDFGSQSGSAYVFTRASGLWTQRAKLTALDAASNDYFGCAVSVSADTAVVGAYGNDDGGTDSGSAYVYAGPPLPVELERFWVE